MIDIGKKNTLVMVKNHEAGIYLDGGPYGEILLPNRYVPTGIKADDEIEVFISFDSEDRIVATTDFPTAMVGEFACLKVKEVTDFGAFMDWGLPKDLLVPFREQAHKMQPNESYVVHVYVDNQSNRIAASSRLNRFLNEIAPEYELNDEVDLLIATKTDLGYKAIVNNSHFGLLYANETFKNIAVGDRLKGYIKKVREDGKIDLTLERFGFDKIDDISKLVLSKLQESNGVLPFTDKTDSEKIREVFGISKKNFKKAIGTLYKKRMISIGDDSISLIK